MHTTRRRTASGDGAVNGENGSAAAAAANDRCARAVPKRLVQGAIVYF